MSDAFEAYCDEVTRLAKQDGFRSDIYRGDDGIFRQLFDSGVPAKFAMQEALVEQDGY
jgi:hypothetical protein